jgi:hypothetical protein
MALGVFSAEGVLSGFSSGTNINITTSQTLSWRLVVTSKMDSVQYARIVYRLGNDSTPTPASDQPSTVACVSELLAPQRCLYSDVFIAPGDEADLGFTWSIQSENRTAGPTQLNLLINGRQFSSPVGAEGGRNFRIIFELWTFDHTSNSFQYGWQGPSSRVGTWLQVWFNAS